MLLIELMSLDELKQNVEILRSQLFEIACLRGYYDCRTNQIRERLNVYLKRYDELRNLKLLVIEEKLPKKVNERKGKLVERQSYRDLNRKIMQ